MYTVVQDVDLAAHAARTRDFLAAEPSLYNVPLTLQALRLSGVVPPEPDLLLLRVLDDAGILMGVAMQTPPRGLGVTRMPPAAVAVLARWLAEHRPSLPGVLGPTPAVDDFAGVYSTATGRPARLDMAQGLFDLAEVIPPAAVPGRARTATPADRDTLVDRAYAFAREAAASGAATGDFAVPIDSRLNTDPTLIWLWEVDGQPVSSCWLTVPAFGVSRVSGVYTPPEHRGHGYASAIVAAATTHALTHGANRCMLYTDLANPTSNKIYQAIGYHRLTDARQYLFQVTGD